MHPISTFACGTRLVLGRREVDGKSNGIPALPGLPALSSLAGCIVTAVAMCRAAGREATGGGRGLDGERPPVRR
jgi:hypothetical protein